MADSLPLPYSRVAARCAAQRQGCEAGAAEVPGCTSGNAEPLHGVAMAERCGVAACEQSGTAISLPGRDVPALCPADDGDAREGLLPGAGIPGVFCGRRSGAVFMGTR